MLRILQLGGHAVLSVISLVVLVGFAVQLLGGPSLVEDNLEAISTLIDEMAKSDALTAQDEALQRCLEGKAHVTHELVHGRISLALAIERFRHYDAQRVDAPEEMPGSDATQFKDLNAVYLNILRWVENALWTDPGRLRQVLNCLDVEWRQLQSGEPVAFWFLVG